MKCEQFRTAISESAAAPSEMSVALQAHLAGCPFCHEFYANEQELFAAIDGELSRVANANVNPSFLPRVRAAIELERPVANRTRWWFVRWPVTAAVVGLAVFLIVFQHIHSRPQIAPQTTARATAANSASSTSSISSSAASTNSGANSGANAATQSATNEIASETRVFPERKRQQEINQDGRKIAQDVRRPRAAGRFAASTQNHIVGSPKFEVLVPPDERIALAKFMARLPQRREMAIALTRPAPAPPKLNVISEPLEIAELKVEPLSPAEDK